MTPDFQLHPREDPTQVSQPLQSSDRDLYRQIIGSLQFAACGTRADIATAVNVLARVQSTPTHAHLKAAKRILQYLKGTDKIGLLFPSKTTAPGLTGYADADWGTDRLTRRSTSGWCFTLNGGLLSWRSRLQRSVALSTCEAEYIALCDAVKEAVYFRHLLSDLGFPISEPTPIFEDNSACISTTSTHFTTERTKHIETRYHYTRAKILDSTVSILKIPTSDQLADIFTKILPGPAFYSGIARLLGNVPAST